MSSQGPVFNRDLFCKRMKKLYAAWKNQPAEATQSSRPLDDCDAIAVGLVKSTEDVVYSKSLSFFIWLFGFELPESLLVLTEEKIYFISSKKKIEFLQSAAEHKVDGVPPVKLMLREKNADGSAFFDDIFASIKQRHKGAAGAGAEAAKIGSFPKDTFKGVTFDQFKARMDTDNTAAFHDISAQVGYAMATHDEKGMQLISAASLATCELFKKQYKKRVLDVIDREKKIRHNQLSQQLEETISDRSNYTQIRDVDNLDFCYPPIVQSSNYALRYSQESDSNMLDYSNTAAIVCAFGLRYNSYCCNIARTLLVSPTAEERVVYELANRALDFLIDNLAAGVVLGTLYESVVEFVKKERMDLAPLMLKSFGFATGIEFREASVSISNRSSVVVRKNMTFVVNIGFSGLKANKTDGKEFAIMLADTVIANEAGAKPTILTASLKRNIKSYVIEISDVADEGENGHQPDVEVLDDEKGGAPSAGSGMNGVGPGGGGGRTTRATRNAAAARNSKVFEQRLRNAPNEIQNEEERRRQHQQKLLESLNTRAQERLATGQNDGGKYTRKKTNISYKNLKDFPAREEDVKQMKIFVDKVHETVILPLYGVPVPFHISMIKSASQSVEGDFTYLRINFHHPGATMIGKEAQNFPNPEMTFLKELTFRSSNNKEPGELSSPSHNLQTAYRLVKELQKRFKTRETEEKEKEGIVKQDVLIPNPNKTQPRLKDLLIRPPISAKRIMGTLESHVNGFRYTSLRGEKVDLLYNNIRHAFFQPCDRELVIIIHFNLKNPIMINKKKFKDIQFFHEVGEVVTDLNKHYSYSDRDDLAQEAAEREMRQRLNNAFKSFCDKSEKVSNGEIDFDTPFRELGFNGVPSRQTVLLQPTTSCLVNLTETPNFIVTLDDIELVHFERVGFNMRNFDMVIVLKDYAQKPIMISAIPCDSIDQIKKWLDECDIHYTEGNASLNWPKIMKTINDDAEGFFEDGGWTFLESDEGADEMGGGGGGEGGGGPAEELDEGDEEYAPSGSDVEMDDDKDDEESSSDEYDDDMDDEEEESGDSEASLGSDEEEGLSWDELEKEAIRSDREKADQEQRNESGTMRSSHGGGGGGGGAKRKAGWRWFWRRPRKEIASLIADLITRAFCCIALQYVVVLIYIEVA